MRRTGSGVSGEGGERVSSLPRDAHTTGVEARPGATGADVMGAGAGVAHAAEIRGVRELLATMILPGATDTASSVSKDVQVQWVDLLGELEAVKNTVTAVQGRLAVALEEATKADEARQGVRAKRRGRGVPNQVGAALQVSPHAGAGFVSTARAWITQMPHTFTALRTGVLSAWRATLLVRETSHLSVQDRALVDEEICGPENLAELARLGTRRLVARIKDLAARLDVHACVKRNAKAVAERSVSVRPAPDLMVYLTALVPMQQGIQAYAHLKKHAETTKAAGDERGVGQLMADTMIERVTGREPGKADDVPVTINLLVSDQTLLAGGDEPGIVLEGAPAGVGTVPAPVVRNLVAHGIDTDAAWLRAIYVDPKGRLLATTSTSRFFPQGLAGMLRARGQGICGTQWCDAPIRHLDHITPHMEGGVTSLDNGQGLCARCNHAKQAPGWVQKTTDLDGRHAVETTTPTGHTTVSVAPPPPTPVRATPATTTGTGATGTGPVPISVLPQGAPTRSEPREHASVQQAPVQQAPVQQAPGQRQPVQQGPAQPEPAHTEPARTERSRPAPATTPPWTPAVGVTGPAPGRIPRSRYSIGCHTTPDPGAIAYRPPRNRNTGPGRRPPRHTRPADLTWAHPR